MSGEEIVTVLDDARCDMTQDFGPARRTSDSRYGPNSYFAHVMANSDLVTDSAYSFSSWPLLSHSDSRCRSAQLSLPCGRSDGWMRERFADVRSQGNLAGR